MCFLTVNNGDKSNFNRIYETKLFGWLEKVLLAYWEIGQREWLVIYHFYAKHKWQINARSAIIGSLVLRRQRMNWNFNNFVWELEEEEDEDGSVCTSNFFRNQMRNLSEFFSLIEKKSVWYLSKANMKIFMNRMHTRNDLCERHSECFHSSLNLSMDSICMKKKNIMQQQTSMDWVYAWGMWIACHIDKSDSFQCAHQVDQSWTLILMIFLFPFNLDAWFSYNCVLNKHAN